MVARMLTDLKSAVTFAYRRTKLTPEHASSATHVSSIFCDIIFTPLITKQQGEIISAHVVLRSLAQGWTRVRHR